MLRFCCIIVTVSLSKTQLFYNEDMKKHTCFIVEDDLVSAQYLKEILENEGIEVVGISDSAELALERLTGCPVDLVMMDIILRGALSGSEAAVMLKQHYPQCKIIFLTAYADEEMIEYALDAQADAYLMKPYREKEIIATVKMVLKKGQSSSDEETHDIYLDKGFVFDRKKHLLRNAKRIIPLSPRKLQLIEILAVNKNSIVSNEQLNLAIWGESGNDNNLRSLISRFKEQIGEEIIINANGLGYMVTSPSAE